MDSREDPTRIGSRRFPCTSPSLDTTAMDEDTDCFGGLGGLLLGVVSLKMAGELNF